jgi:type I restriction enzyme, S subunit
MRSDWPRVPLRDCARWLSGGTPATSRRDYWGGDIPWISAASLSSFRIYDSDRRVTPAGAQNGTRVVPPGTTLFVVRGMSLKSEFRIGVAMRDVAFGQDCKGLIARADLDPFFLAYAIKGRSEEILRAVDEASHGTGRLQTEVLEALEICVPPLGEQRRIAKVLGALDDKIEHDRVRAAHLLDLAQLAFGRWFRSLRDLPRARVVELISSGQLVVNDGYRAKNSEMAAAGIPFLRGGNVNGDLELEGADLLGHDAILRAGDKVSRIGDAFFTAKGTVGRIGRVSRWTPRFVYSPQIAFWRSLDEDALAPEYLYLWLASDDFIEQRDAVKGQTDMADYVNLRDQRAMMIAVAQPERQRELTSLVRPLLDAEALAKAESRALTTIRDVLLPKLVSGAIRVPDSYDSDDALGTVAEAAGVAMP